MIRAAGKVPGMSDDNPGQKFRLTEQSNTGDGWNLPTVR